MQSARLFAIALVAVLATFAGTARAARPKTFALNWVREAGAESCISSQALATLIEHTFGPVFVAPSEAELAIEGRVARDTQWRARIAVSDRNGALLGSRELASADLSCRALVPQLVLVIAIAIDPELATRGLPKELLALLDDTGEVEADALAELRAKPPLARDDHGEGTAAPPARDATAEPPTSAAVAQAPATSFGPDGAAPRDSGPLRDYRLALSVHFDLGSGLLPVLGSGPGVSLALVPLPPISLLLSGTYWFEQDLPIAAPLARSAHVSFGLLLGSLSVCVPALRANALRANGCLGLSVAARSMRSSGLSGARDTPVRLDLGPSLSSELLFAAVGRFAPLVGIALRVALRGDLFGYYDSSSHVERELFRPAAFQVLAYFGGAVLL